MAWYGGAEDPLSGPLRTGPTLALLITGSVGTASAFLLNNWALTQVNATTAAAAVTLIPLFALAFSTLLLGEPFTAGTAVAAALILAALTGYLRTSAVGHPRARPKRGSRRTGTTVSAGPPGLSLP